MPETETKLFYTRAEVAAALRMSLSTLDRRIADKEIPASKSGRQVLIHRDAFYAAVEARRRGEL